jgi:23S rRNA C2498 (ribose-2'-O)-methylase RlmM
MDPWYEVQSYEWDCEKGSIGRNLQCNEWRASQAFQAFSAWESMKMQTLAGVCGYSWCCTESGANMFAYQKPLVDPYYVPKLAFYANKMIFARMWAGSDDVDTVYGPEDCVHPVIFNLDEACTVNLTVELKNTKGKVIEKKIFKNIKVEAGRSVTRLEPFRFKTNSEGCHFIEYKINKIN